jgi:hypothetical protein
LAISAPIWGFAQHCCRQGQSLFLETRIALNATVEYDICGLLVYTAVASIPREGSSRMRMAVIRSKDGSEPF